MSDIWWIGFTVFATTLLAVDLFVFNRHAHRIGLREAALFSATYMSLAVALGVLLWFTEGSDTGSQYLTAWIVEQSLSVDNLFVFILIMGSFAVPAAYQNRLLLYGVAIAILLRLVFILVGVSLVENFDWILYVFGAFLVYTAARLAISQASDEEEEFKPNVLIRFAQRRLRATTEFSGTHFFVRRDGVRYATPMLIAVVALATTDLIFAVDSIPAVIGVTTDRFVVVSSNVMAVLGLRALYFVLAAAVTRFVYLQPAVAIILAFVGVKMLLHSAVDIPSYVALGVILVTLGIGIAASLVKVRHDAAAARERGDDDDHDAGRGADQRDTEPAGAASAGH